ncbi:MAG: glycoside hydrolase family 2, partial [Anaerolineales bacterium]
GYGTGVYAFWTRRFIADHEPVVPLAALSWLWQEQLPNLVRSLLRRPQSLPLKLQLALLSGCLRGPLAYLKSKRQLSRMNKPV